jgi:hypothetical protein
MDTGRRMPACLKCCDGATSERWQSHDIWLHGLEKCFIPGERHKRCRGGRWAATRASASGSRLLTGPETMNVLHLPAAHACAGQLNSKALLCTSGIAVHLSHRGRDHAGAMFGRAQRHPRLARPPSCCASSWSHMAISSAPSASLAARRSLAWWLGAGIGRGWLSNRVR